MNYSNIYENFITSRRTREPELVDSNKYYEKHHILPTALGGDNTFRNIIKLSADEHLFAHLLLAKIHGNLMWLAVKAMLDFEPNKNKRNRRITNKKLRRKFNYVRVNIAKSYSERFSGQNNPQADRKKYLLKNIDGHIATGDRTELISKTNITRSGISALLLGSKKTYNGWYYPQKNPLATVGPPSGIDSPHSDKKIYEFFHMSGKTFKGTQIEFKEKFGLSANSLVHGVNKSTQDGWGMNPQDCGNWINGKMLRAKNAADSRGDISGINNPRAIKKKFQFINTKTQEIKCCQRATMANYLQVTSAQMHGMIQGHYQIKGWCLEQHINKKSNKGGWDNRGKNITIYKNIETFTGTRKECAAFIGVTDQTISAFVLGRYKTCKGWKLKDKNA
jgi:hypothetical protein